MAVVFRQPGRQSGTRPADQAGLLVRRIDPALKAWLDNVIIPNLVREYLSTESATSDNTFVGGFSEPIQ